MAVCCQNLPLGALSSRSALFMLVGVLFKKFGLFLNTGLQIICADAKHYTLTLICNTAKRFSIPEPDLTVYIAKTLKVTVLNSADADHALKFRHCTSGCLVACVSSC
jgi:hypothetical protein